MKKLVRGLFGTLVACVGALMSAAGSVGCGYHNFKNYIKNREDFVYVISQKENKDWLTTNKKVWSKITDRNSDESFWNQIKKPDYSAKSLFRKPSSAASKYEAMHFYNLQIDKDKNVFEDKRVKKIIDYVVDKTAIHDSVAGDKIKYLTREDIGITATPLFLFFAGGEYQGFYQGTITKIVQNRTDEKHKSHSAMWIIVQHIVHFAWNPDS